MYLTGKNDTLSVPLLHFYMGQVYILRICVLLSCSFATMIVTHRPSTDIIGLVYFLRKCACSWFCQRQQCNPLLYSTQKIGLVYILRIWVWLRNFFQSKIRNMTKWLCCTPLLNEDVFSEKCHIQETSEKIFKGMNSSLNWVPCLMT